MEPREVLAPLVSAVERSPVVAGVAVVGSHASGYADAESDIDLFVYVSPDAHDEVLALRRRLVDDVADRSRFWSIQQTGHPYADTWTLRGTEICLDIMFWTTSWADEELDWRLVHHQRQVGDASTAFWRSIRDGIPLFDRSGWVESLQRRAREPYPDELRNEVLRYDLDLLGRTNPFSFFHQLDKAVRRRDHVAANHRSAKWIACYFDAIFAANRVLHPGEKRLIEFVIKECRHVPERFDEDVVTLTHLTAALEAGTARHLDDMLASLSSVVDGGPTAGVSDHREAGARQDHGRS